MSDSSYGIGLSNVASDEERRLAAVESLFDSATFRHLDALGIETGMKCLEVGSGAGSVARHMADRVGNTGSVVATDIDAGLLDDRSTPNLEFRQHDVCRDPLPVGAFDIIHARLLLEHLPSRVGVLDKLAAALAPGGWLLIEDLDFTDWLYLPEGKLLCEPHAVRPTLRAFHAAAASMGSWDGEWGRELPVHFMKMGLGQVGSEVRLPVIFGGSPQAAFITVSVRQLTPVLLNEGRVSQLDVDALIDAFESPGALVGLHAMVSAWGTAR
jgi:SAM-dependent methyltransferase